jgi:deoxyribonuclease V
VQFPYISGLLAFREGPALIAAYEKLDQAPDLIVFNGHGYAHPRRCGLASHLGVLLNLPSIGVANRIMIGDVGVLGTKRGSIAPIHDGRELIGMAVRTQENARPIYASIGHKVDLEQAVELILMTTTIHRFPENRSRLPARMRRTR